MCVIIPVYGGTLRLYQDTYIVIYVLILIQIMYLCAKFESLIMFLCQFFFHLCYICLENLKFSNAKKFVHQIHVSVF